MIVLEALDLQWSRGPEDDPADQCAHGRVRFEVNETVFVRPEDGIWAVSAAALFLLRTIDLSHTRERPVTQDSQLFPHCGHTMWPVEEMLIGLWCPGCGTGIDPQVVHEGRRVRITAEDGRSEVVEAADWSSAVLRFADQVRDYYRNSRPKRPHRDEHDRRGVFLFWNEWETRRRNASP